jgi:hypothetical protein
VAVALLMAVEALLMAAVALLIAAAAWLMAAVPLGRVMLAMEMMLVDVLDDFLKNSYFILKNSGWRNN